MKYEILKYFQGEILEEYVLHILDRYGRVIGNRNKALNSDFIEV